MDFNTSLAKPPRRENRLSAIALICLSNVFFSILSLSFYCFERFSLLDFSESLTIESRWFNQYHQTLKITPLGFTLEAFLDKGSILLFTRSLESIGRTKGNECRGSR